MDFQRFIRNATSDARNTLMELWDHFLMEKVETTFNQHLNKGEMVSMEKLPYQLRNLYPEAEVIIFNSVGYKTLCIQELEKNMEWAYVVLPYVVLENKDYSFRIYRRIPWGMHTTNTLEYIKCINDKMPLWKAEFEELCSTHQSAIEQREKKRMKRWAKESLSDFSRWYLQEKTDNFLMMERSTPDYADRIMRTIQEAGLRFIKIQGGISLKINNMRVEIINRKMFSNYEVAGCYQNIKVDFRDKDVSMEKLSELDRLFPIWQQEAKTLLYEIQKKEKLDQIECNVMRALVKQKMRELGLEYQIEDDRNSGNITLTVKLEKRRMMKVNLQNGDTEWVKRQLNTLAQHIATLNNIPMDFRVYF